MGDFDVGDLGAGGPDELPGAGRALLYPGGVSEVEILLPLRLRRFASKAGPARREPLRHDRRGHRASAAIGELVLWEGAQDDRLLELAAVARREHVDRERDVLARTRARPASA